MKNKKFLALGLFAILPLVVSCGVNANNGGGDDDSTSSMSASESYTGTEVSGNTASSSPVETSMDAPTDSAPIVLKDGASTSSSSDVSIDNSLNQITISKVGTYYLTGSLSNGNILISATKTDALESVTLILNGVSISKDGANNVYGPIYSSDSAKLIVTLPEGSASFLSDTRGSALNTDDNDDTAALFSNKKLTIGGLGSLTIDSTFNNGAGSDSKIRMQEGVLSVSAPNNALKAHNSIVLGQEGSSPSFYLTSTGTDGAAIRVDEVDEDVTSPVYGNVETDDDIAGIEIKDGYYEINAKGKGISSEGYLYMEGGNGTITSSADKGIKSELDLHVDSGKFTIVSKLDDCIHSTTASLYCAGGQYNLTSGSGSSCQGLKAEEDVFISGGTFVINNSNEGIAAHRITASGGTTLVKSSDDGWSAGGTDSQPSSLCKIDISGGSHYVYASGDGLDSNGTITISGGMTVVSAPSSAGNGPLDHEDKIGSITQSGGILVAYGTSGMAEGADAGEQGSILLGSHTSVSSGSYLLFKAGSAAYAVKTTRNATTTYCSFPEFVSGAAYEVSYSSSISGETALFEEAGLYSLSSYSGGTSLTSGTFSSNSLHVSSGTGSGGPTGGGGPRH